MFFKIIKIIEKNVTFVLQKKKFLIFRAIQKNEKEKIEKRRECVIVTPAWAST